MHEWRDRSLRAAFASHRLVGWIYWDPVGIEGYAALGVPDGVGYYITTRAGALGDAGPEVVTAAYYSIHSDFVRVSYELLEPHGTSADAVRVRDDAVLAGLRAYAPGICEALGAMAEPLWAAADVLELSARPLFAAQLRHRRTDEPLLSAWLAINAIREWRGDTHWALHAAEGLTGIEAGILDGAWRSYDDDWLPRSRGADDALVTAGYERLAERGLVVNGAVTAEAVAYRQELEDRLDDLSSGAWRALGAAATDELVALVDTVGDALMARVDATAGERWMPAGRHNPGLG